MTLREKQSVFIQNVAKLITWVHEQGHSLTAGEMYRTEEQQKIYLKSGKSKAARSRHQDRLAVDLNLFIGGQYRTDKEAYKLMADYWKSLHPDNVAGYDFGWDANHFEMKP